ncbi:site-specific integrase [Globicatella sp. PHS-GS-PNBC-21-1553]|uniref:site-specific integrase n=1 Tax=Globicatella sp. PHS-GS-PNBC-21-1553 TaxID=2885764 RepID=UPI00298F38D7|nr:site-specific integrase [Globicatella sp. PHS-GS-PNBC-21-1553]WPC08791.1 site-specific integrase [Globicatella sp. PHS-GS-PNBC-21-1553]
MIKKYTKKDGSTAYMFVAYLGVDPITGKQKRTTRRGFKTKREASIAEAKLQTEVEENGFGVAPKKMTFKEAYEGWLEQYSLTVRESSLNVVKSIIESGILPEIGNLNVNSISRRKAQQLVKEWHSKYKTFRKYKVYATQIMDYALEEGVIKTNPFSKVKTPRSIESVEDDTEKYYTKDELKKFLAFIKDDTMYYAIFRLLAFSGIRKGELMALQWSDIDNKVNTLSINKTVTYGEKSRQIIGPTKTQASNRIIKLDKTTLSVLQKWRIEQRTLLLKNGINSNNKEQFLFTNPFTNELLSKMTITHKLWYICESNNFKKITLHGFRHTACSLMFDAGLSVKDVQKILGHSSVKTTLDIYAHVTKHQQENAAEKLEKYIQF